MGLDIHVMRPKRFYLREYELPVQQYLPGVPIQVIGAEPMSAFDAETAEALIVKAIRLQQLDQPEHRYVLPADDEIHYSERFSYDAFDLLREFAAFLDYPPKRHLCWGQRAFGDGYALDSLPSLKVAWRKQRSSYPHLVFHEDNRGFYAPTTLKFPVLTEYGYIGSTASLRRELTALAAIAHKALRHREQVTGAIELLLQATEASERSGLPVVFDG